MVYLQINRRSLVRSAPQALNSFADNSLASSASKVAPVSLGFSLAEEGDGQDDSDANGGDSKGLSHTSRCARIVFWMCELTMRHTQLLSQRK